MLLLLLILHALAFISGYGYALVFPIHSPPCVFFLLLVTCCRVQHGLCSVVVLRRSAWSRGGALLRRLSQCRCKCELVCPCESLASRDPLFHCLSARCIEEQSSLRHSPCSSWGGWDGAASAEEAESSANFASSDRPSAVLPIVSPPRGLIARVS